MYVCGVCVGGGVMNLAGGYSVPEVLCYVHRQDSVCSLAKMAVNL